LSLKVQSPDGEASAANVLAALKLVVDGDGGPPGGRHGDLSERTGKTIMRLALALPPHDVRGEAFDYVMRAADDEARKLHDALYRQ
jgi:hypothetical protein